MKHEGSSESPLPSEQEIGFYIEIWKKEVDVQQHFNDIEFRIRGLALTVATFVLGAGAVAAKDGVKAGPVSLGAAVITLGLLLWLAFYFVDRYWYHPLLKGAVRHGEEVEAEIKKRLGHAGMTAAITESSVVTLRGPMRIFEPLRMARKPEEDRKLHSEDKITGFYRIGAVALVIAALGMQVAATLSDEPDSSEVVTVRLIEPTAEPDSTANTHIPPAPSPSDGAGTPSPEPSPAVTESSDTLP